MPYILIQINEGIAKLVTLMILGLEEGLKGLNAIPISYYNNSLTMKHTIFF
jgi:hypothetical protein